MLSNQFSNFLSSITKDYDLTVNYSQTNDPLRLKQESEVQLAISKNLFDDRITLNGKVGVPLDSSQSTPIGEVDAKIKISENGNISGKMFYKHNKSIDITSPRRIYPRSRNIYKKRF